MLNTIRCKVNCGVSKLKQFFDANKVQCILALAILILSVLFSVWKLVSDYDNIKTINVIVLIKAEEYSIFSFIMGVLVIDVTFFVLITIGVSQIYLLFGSYVGLFFITFSYVKGYLYSLFSGGIAGILSFILYFLPLFTLVYCSYNVTLIKLCDLTGVRANGSRFVNFSFYKSTVFTTVLKAILVNTLVIITFSLVAFLALSIGK